MPGFFVDAYEIDDVRLLQQTWPPSHLTVFLDSDARPQLSSVEFSCLLDNRVSLYQLQLLPISQSPDELVPVVLLAGPWPTISLRG